MLDVEGHLARALVLRAAERAALVDRPAIEHGSRRIAYGQLARLVAATARRFASQDVGPGDRVVVGFGNRAEHIVAVLAAALRGAIAVPVSDKIGPERLSYIVRSTAPKLTLLDPEALEIDL